MPFPTTFANLAAGVEPLSLFDTMFNVVGGMGTIYCTAVGASTIVLTPTTNMPTVNAYNNYQAFGFVAVGVSSGAVTLNVSAQGALPAYAGDGVTQLGSGALTTGVYYVFAYNSALNSGTGGFQIVSTGFVVSAPDSAGQSTFKNLRGAWASNTTATFTADQVILQTSGFVSFLATSYNVTLNTATSGAGGLDTGSTAASTWYNVFAIYNGATTSILMSVSATAPTMPSGYTYKARIGTLYLDGSKNIRGFIQRNQRTQYVVGNNLSALPIMASGAAGSVTVPTWVAVAWANFAPPTVAGIIVAGQGTGGNQIMLAPNNSYGALTSLTNSPPISLSVSGLVGGNMALQGSMLVESANIYWANNGAQATLYCFGYEDNI